MTLHVLIGLILGFATGLAIAGREAFAAIPAVLDPVGTIFINAIRMTVIPLVVSSLIVGVASAPDTKTVGRLGGRAVVMFVVFVMISSLIGVTITPAAFGGIQADPAAIAALQGGSSAAMESAKSIPTFSQWLVSLVPVNPVKAAADGAMLPSFSSPFCSASPSRR